MKVCKSLNLPTKRVRVLELFKWKHPHCYPHIVLEPVRLRRRSSGAPKKYEGVASVLRNKDVLSQPNKRGMSRQLKLQISIGPQRRRARLRPMMFEMLIRTQTRDQSYPCLEVGCPASKDKAASRSISNAAVFGRVHCCTLKKQANYWICSSDR